MKSIRCVVVLVVVLGFAGHSRADYKIVLESFTGGKSDATADQLKSLLEALANRGFVGGYEGLGRTFESRVSRPAIVKGLPADFAAQVDAGHKAWLAGKFEDAIKILQPLVDGAHANAGAFARDQDLREPLSKALLALALAHARRADPAAAQQVFGELVRSFPTLAPSRGIYGPEAVQAFEDAKKTVTAQGRGKLVVRTNIDNAIVFIDEKIETAGTVTKENLIPGDYRVFAQLGKQLSRIHRVTVRANETTQVTIDATFDQAVQTSPTWTGLSFSTAGDREKWEVHHAATFGNAIDASAVAVIGIDQVRGRPAVVGILVDRISGTEIRRASVALDPDPGDERMNALAQFLAGENLAPAGIDVLTTRTVKPGSDGVPTGPEKPSGGGWGGWKWIAGGLGLGALGVGGYLVVIDGRCKVDVMAGMICPDLENSATAGYATLAGGAVLTGISVYLFVRGRGSATRTAFVAPTGGGAVAGLVGRF